MDTHISIHYDPGFTVLSFLIPIIAGRLAFQILNMHRINHFGIDYIAMDNLQPVRLDESEYPGLEDTEDSHAPFHPPGTAPSTRSAHRTTSLKSTSRSGFRWGFRRRKDIPQDIEGHKGGEPSVFLDNGSFRVMNFPKLGKFTLVIASFPRLVASGFALAVAICGMVSVH